MNIKFTKMHGTGNDFIMLNGMNSNKNIDYKNLARELCKRHFSVGADGIIIILPPENKESDFRMRIFNADGSEAEMCGNGIRCFAHFVKANKLTEKNKIKVETMAGLIIPEIIEFQPKKSKIKVNMGKPLFKSEQIPINLDSTNPEIVEDYPLEIEKRIFNINCVSMGNPHSVIFNEDIEKLNIKKWGPKIENSSVFPEKTNVEFIKILNPSEIIMKVWERGSGITLACGTGACASVAAGINKGLLNSEVLVHLPGGDLIINWEGNNKNVYMSGPAVSVYEGIKIIN